MAGALGLAAATVPAATGLWSHSRTTLVAALQVGAVQFSGAELSTPGDVEYSEDGGHVTVVMPGTEILKVLDPETVTDGGDGLTWWTFKVAGRGHGITGLDYVIGFPPPAAGSIHARTTTYVFPAGQGGDCVRPDGAVPVPPTARYTLQNAGTNPTGTVVEQVWCVLMDWDDQPDAVYRNAAWASALALDATTVTDIAGWDAVITFPPSPNALGEYLNLVTAIGQNDDGSWAEASSRWRGVVYEDPSGEPDVTITIDPIVTNLNPDVPDGDSFSITRVRGQAYG